MRAPPIVKSALGVRRQPFSEAVRDTSETVRADWPCRAPAGLSALSHTAERCASSEQRHARFVADGKLAYADAGVSERQVVMKLMRLCTVVDQLDLPQLAWAERAMTELKRKRKFIPAPPKGANSVDPFDDAHLYPGLSSARGQLAVSLELERLVGQQLSSECVAIEERRNALKPLRGGGGMEK